MGGQQAARVLSTVRGGFAGRRRARRLRGADPRDVRARGLPVLRDGAPLGRRGHRPARHAARPGAGHRGGAPRADPGDALRRLPDVTGERDSASRGHSRESGTLPGWPGAATIDPVVGARRMGICP